MLLDSFSASSGFPIVQMKHRSCPSFRSVLNAGIGPSLSLDRRDQALFDSNKEIGPREETLRPDIRHEIAEK